MKTVKSQHSTRDGETLSLKEKSSKRKAQAEFLLVLACIPE